MKIKKQNNISNMKGADISDLFGKFKTKKTPQELKNEGKEGWK